MVTSVKSLNDALKDTLKTLNEINDTIKHISAPAQTAADSMRKTVTKNGQRNLTKGSKVAMGTDGANFTQADSGTSQTKVPASQPQSAAQAKNANDVNMPWMSPTMAKFSIAGGVAQMGAGVAGAAFALGPDLGATISRASNYYGTAQYSPTSLGYKQLQTSTMGALGGSFGRGISGIGEDAAAAAILTQQYGYAPGSSPYLQSMREVGGAYRQFNMGNAAAATAIGGLQTGAMGANLYQYGISQFDKNGNPVSESQMAKQLFNRIFQGRGQGNAKGVQQSLQYGLAGADLNAMGFSADQQQLFKAQFLALAQNKNADLSKMSGAGNPNAAGQKIITSQTNLMQASQDSMIKGYQAAATTITDVNKKMAEFGQSVIQAKAYMQGLGQSGVGGALTSLIGGFASGVKNIAEGMAALYAAEQLGIPLGKGGSALLGAGRLVGTGAKALGRAAGVVGLSAGAGYAMGQGAKVIGSETGLNKSSTGRDIVRGGSIAAGAGAGALAGSFAGPPGLVIGALVGGIAGYFGSSGGSSYGGFGASFGAKGGMYSQTQSTPGAYSSTAANTSAINPYSGQSNKQTLSSPIPGTAPTTMYGAKDPGMWNGAKNYHTGDDYAVPVGTSVKAVADGTVYDDSPGADFGVYVQIDHGNGYQTLYGHLQSRSVKIGQKVVTGQEIGKSGQSGNVTGPHLHFEVRKGKNNPVDPSQFLTGTGGTKQTVSGKTVSAPGTVLGTGDQRAWATDFLKGMGAPATSANVKAMTTWMAYEGGQWKNSAHYNPLNTTLGASGATDMNSAGVKSYTSYSQGLQSNISTLQENQRGYAAIRAALLKGNDTAGVLGAVNHSAWGTKIPGYGGGNSGFGASITAPQQSGSTNVQITVNIAQASQDEAVKFAKKVQSILEENNSISTMGSR
jgi:murein DD-endopeptidase MepM/ murein hydrolase activator NlpD